MNLDLALPVDQLPWRSSPFMRGLRSLPVRYDLAALPEQRLAYDPATQSARTELPDPSARQRSSLWRYLTELIRTGR